MNIQQIISYLKIKSKNLPPLQNTIKIDFGRECIYIDGFKNNIISTQNRNADCTIIVSRKNFLKLMYGQLKPTWGVITGRIKIQGDRNILTKLNGLL